SDLLVHYDNTTGDRLHHGSKVIDTLTVPPSPNGLAFTVPPTAQLATLSRCPSRVHRLLLNCCSQLVIRLERDGSAPARACAPPDGGTPPRPPGACAPAAIVLRRDADVSSRPISEIAEKPAELRACGSVSKSR